MTATTRIAIWAPAFQSGGGIQTFSSEVALALADWQPTLVSRDRYQVKLLPMAGPLSTARFAAAASISVWRSRPQCILSTHLNFGPAARIIKLLTGIPYVLVAHGIDVHPALSKRRRRALKQANQILSVSHDTLDKLHRFVGLDKERIEILPNTVDDQRFNPGPADRSLLSRLQIPADRQIVLTVARLAADEQYKGYDVILKAWKTIRSVIPNAHYVLCGKGSDEARIRKLIQELDIKASVTMTGFLPDEDLPKLYRCARVFAMPSTGEGFGIVFLEAMASGIPVLAGNCDGSVDALANGQLGRLVNPLSTDEVAAGIIYLMQGQGPEWWYNPGELRSRMLQLFGRAQFAAKLKALLEKVVAK